MPVALDNLMQAQSRVFDLWALGTEPSTREMKVAMNRLMSLIRNADPEAMTAFEAWRRAEGRRRGLASQAGKRR